MVVNAAIMPGEEVFNTYGAKLTNAELLVRYGFILDANDNDILTWTTDQVWDAAGSALTDLPPGRWNDDDGYAIYMEILRDWQFDAGWGDSELVIDTGTVENRNPLYMTADGVLSHKLWLAIALAASRRQGTTVDATRTRELVTRMARTQIRMELGHARARNEGSDKGDDDGDDDDAYEVRGHATDCCLVSAQADIENVEIKLKLCVQLLTTPSVLRLYGAWNRSFGAKTRVRLPPVTRESTGVGQTGSHDRGVMRAEARSDFPFKRTTARRSRSWLA